MSADEDGTVVTDAVFARQGVRWGFRGDPHFWSALQERFVGTTQASPEAFREALSAAFDELTAEGRSTARGRGLALSWLPRGGLSGGIIALSFWNDTALPLLVERFAGLR
ncbi:MAG: hypothetical protein AAF447_03490 [Myxococcota bacterium]